MTQETLFGECLHLHRIVVLQTSGPHHARELCADCRKFMGWIAKPETIEKRARNREFLSALSKLAHLTEWEREFIRSLSSTKNISPKQQAQLDKLRDKYCG